ncbi:hypothetical protein N7466_000656 [Penicillium verhagenii]|uniref:uncharacterized protein n=1 Tax=Penicillium verhagenii TaxID=1562060 RepID=UPI0025451B26|nr:uncharacterized protein N7466_000656 [Penicillium verhagenii]KAJ5947641.1 hypothetical protein N7466_000656 [Penicillium verhagenii]
MDRNRPLPIADEWQDPDSYIEALLFFANSNELFINLCGGVHILDFLTREPDLYTTLLPEDWIAFFHQHDTQDIIRLLLREDIKPLREPGDATRTWNGGAFPPTTLLDYIYNVRRLSLRRDFASPDLGKKTKLNKHVAMGMKKKKLHEVQHFSRYVADLSETVEQRRGEPVSHIVDFGSGQNYLGRTLASSPYHKHIIAIERKHQYISGAKDMDVNAKLAEKEKKDHTYVINNKKNKACNECDGGLGVADSEPTDPSQAENLDAKFGDVPAREVEENIEDVTIFKMLGEITLEPDELLGTTTPNVRRQKAEEEFAQARGTLSYIEHEIEDGYLEPIIDHVMNPPPAEKDDGKNSEEPSITEQPSKETRPDPRVMVVSLHSCGNLVHHGVRSLILNPSVVAVAMIGCCYNLMTERLGPATYKLPILRSVHPRLYETGTSYDPHGFPMSKLYEDYKNAGTDGMKLNITARSMAVQAPYNWGHADSEDFFTRNYYRALLQRILVDRGVVPKPGAVKDLYEESNGTAAVIIGSLGKTAFKSFTAYMRAAIVKLTRDPNHGVKVSENVGTMSDEDFQRYDTEYRQARKNLSVVWSLMAFSAQVVETVIVVDRWQYLREHDSVKECWVEPVFDYSESPRNLAVIGLKK